MNFRVLANDGSVVAEGRSLQQIRNELHGLVGEVDEEDEEWDGEWEYYEEEIEAPRASCDEDDVGPDIIGTLDPTVQIEMQGVLIKAYPALVVEGKQVNVRALESESAAARSNRLGLRQLVKKRLAVQLKDVRSNIPGIQKLCLKYSELGGCEALKDDIIDTVIDELFLADAIATPEAFEEAVQQGKGELYAAVAEWSGLLDSLFDDYREIRKMIRNPNLAQLDTVSDIQRQLDALFCQDFITLTDKHWLKQYPRYLRAVKLRYDKSSHNVARDRQQRVAFTELWEQYEKRKRAADEAQLESAALEEYRWMLEEYRVSLFAQEVKTLMPVSEKRLKQAWAQITDV